MPYPASGLWGGNGVAVHMRDALVALLAVGDVGFAPTGVHFIHESGDCSGPRYIPLEDHALLQSGWIAGHKAIWGGLPGRMVQYFSNESIPYDGDPALLGICSANSGYTLLAGEANIFDLSALNLVAPFHVE
jgi:hypothetical protein